jgi:hypothetical protein
MSATTAAAMPAADTGRPPPSPPPLFALGRPASGAAGWVVASWAEVSEPASVAAVALGEAAGEAVAFESRMDTGAAVRVAVGRSVGAGLCGPA